MTLASALVPEEPTAESAKPDRRILWLVVGHIAIGLLTAIAGASLPDTFVLWRISLILAVLFSQTDLLGIWVSLGPNPMWQRAIGFVGGMGYFLLFLTLADFKVDNVLLTSLAILVCVATVPFLVMRLVGRSIQQSFPSSGTFGSPQFSISHLLAAISIVASMLTGRIQVRMYCESQNVAEIDAFYDMCCVATIVGMLQVYIVLAMNRPYWGIGITALVSFAFYLIVAVLIGAEDVDDFSGPVTIAVALSVTLASLLIVRSFGYRLVTQPSLHRRATPTIGVESFITRAAD